jgi:hypothetical protein
VTVPVYYDIVTFMLFNVFVACSQHLATHPTACVFMNFGLKYILVLNYTALNNIPYIADPYGPRMKCGSENFILNYCVLN